MLKTAAANTEDALGQTRPCLQVLLSLKVQASHPFLRSSLISAGTTGWDCWQGSFWVKTWAMIGTQIQWKIPWRRNRLPTPVLLGFPADSDGKQSACNAGDLSSIPGLGRSPGGRHGSPLQYSGLENPMDRGVWWATADGVAKSQTRLND